MNIMKRKVLIGVAVVALLGCTESSDTAVSEISVPEIDDTDDGSQEEVVEAEADQDNAQDSGDDPEGEGTSDDTRDEVAAPSVGTVYTTRLGARLFETTVAAGPLNVRDRPGLSGTTVEQLEAGAPVVVTGLSERVDRIDSHEGRWLRIADPEVPVWGRPSLGWVFSKYVAGAENLEPREMEIVGLTDPKPNQSRQLRLRLDDEEHQVSKHQVDSQDFYSFVWSDGEDGYSYRDVPGSYVWRPGEAQAELITHDGSSMESAWVTFSDDFQYMFQDAGTGMGVRGLSVFDVASGERVFNGGYYRDINLDGYEIDIVVRYTDRGIERGLIDDESIRLAESFMEHTPEDPEIPDTRSQLLIVEYRLNVDTGEREHTGTRWIGTQ